MENKLPVMREKDRQCANSDWCNDYKKPKVELDFPVKLFSGDRYYPNGGWKDFDDRFCDIELAKEYIEGKMYVNWAQIVVDDKIVLYGIIENPDSNWIWSEQEILPPINHCRKEFDELD